MILFNTGRVLGWLIVLGFVIAFIYPMLKYYNKHYISKRERDDPWRKRFQGFMRTYIKAHPYIGMTVTGIMLVHLVIQFSFYGFFLSGFIAGGLLLIQSGLGLYGFYYKKRKPGPWLTVHRWLPLVMLIAVGFHIFSALR